MKYAYVLFGNYYVKGFQPMDGMTFDFTNKTACFISNRDYLYTWDISRVKQGGPFYASIEKLIGQFRARYESLKFPPARDRLTITPSDLTIPEIYEQDGHQDHRNWDSDYEDCYSLLQWHTWFKDKMTLEDLIKAMQ